MKIEIEISVQSDRITPSIYAKLLEMCPPEVRKPFSVRLKLPESDERMRAILRFLDEQGLRQHQGGRLEKNTFELSKYKNYGGEDLNQAAYLQLYHTQLISQDQVRDGMGRLVLPLAALKKPFLIGAVLFHATIVHRSLMEKLLVSGMEGMEFKETVLARAGHAGTKSDFWELTSPLRMPPHSRKDELVCFNNTPFSGDYSSVVGIKQEYRPPELRYSHKDLASLGDLDFALTFEGFPQEHWVVVSQRFRQFCLKHELKLDWIPVRIDPD